MNPFNLAQALLPMTNRVDWIIERCKKNSKVSGISDDEEDVAEDDGVAVDEVLSGCQIIRLYHRSSESYLAATATKMDRGKVFWSHRSQSDASQGSGKIANTYWMVIDGDGDVSLISKGKSFSTLTQPSLTFLLCRWRTPAKMSVPTAPSSYSMLSQAWCSFASGTCPLLIRARRQMMKNTFLMMKELKMHLMMKMKNALFSSEMN